MIMKLILRWRLRRAERALTVARLRRETLDLQDADYGGILLNQLAEERMIEQGIGELSRRRAVISSAPTVVHAPIG